MCVTRITFFRFENSHILVPSALARHPTLSRARSGADWTVRIFDRIFGLVVPVSWEHRRHLPHALCPSRGVPHGTPQFKMVAMMLSGLSAGSLAAKTALPARSATKARAGRMIKMKPMGASARGIRFSTVSSAAPSPVASPPSGTLARFLPRSDARVTISAPAIPRDSCGGPFESSAAR